MVGLSGRLTQPRRGHPPAGRDRPQVESQMTDQPTASRYVLRKGAVHGQWMIWDRQGRGPAKLERGWAVGLSENQARQLLDQLTQTDGDK
jgi:hypothetical protein